MSSGVRGDEEQDARERLRDSYPKPSQDIDAAFAAIMSRLDEITRAVSPRESAIFAFPAASTEETDLIRRAAPPLPDPKLVRRIIRQRRARAKFIDGELLSEPAWNMLLDLTAARAEGKRVSVTSLCIASGVPSTTALRWITQMVDEGLFVRTEDSRDRRRAFIALSDDAERAMARYFASLGGDAGAAL